MVLAAMTPIMKKEELTTQSDMSAGPRSEIMEAFVQFLAARSINLAPLIEKRYPVEQADTAYAAIRESGSYTALIDYAVPKPWRLASQRRTDAKEIARRIQGRVHRAGGFARNIIFPALRNRKGVILESVATASGHCRAISLQVLRIHQGTNSRRPAAGCRTDGVFILSRHDSHSRYVVAALTNHKAVFVEKPWR